MAAPWDQLAGEPNESYGRFLLYRNLGPKRAMRRAYHRWLTEYDGYRGGLKGLHVPGHWIEEARKHSWCERASSWDVRNLAAYGSKVAALHVQAVAMVARKNAAAARAMKPGSPGWLDLMASLKVVAAFLTPDIARGIEDRNKSARRPAAAAAGGDGESVA